MDSKHYNDQFSFIWNVANDVLVQTFNKDDNNQMVEQQPGLDNHTMGSLEWEKQHVVYSLLVKKLPKLKIDDYTDGLLDDIDFDTYNIVKEEECAIILENKDVSVASIPKGIGGGKPQHGMDDLLSIVKDYNDTYVKIEWQNREELQQQIEEIPARISSSVEFANIVGNGDKLVEQITFNDDIINIVTAMLDEKTEFVQTYFENPDFSELCECKSVSDNCESIV